MHRHSLSIISDAKSYASVDKLVLKLAAAYLTGAELTLFTNLANSMNNSANSGAVKIFDTSSKNIDKCNFQLGVAE
jgi:hypothetical protein